MKILILDAGTNKPLANTPLNFLSKNGDKFSGTTDASGRVNLDEKYSGQQITATTSSGGTPGQGGQWATASEGATLRITTKQTTTSTTSSTTSGSSYK